MYMYLGLENVLHNMRIHILGVFLFEFFQQKKKNICKIPLRILKMIFFSFDIGFYFAYFVFFAQLLSFLCTLFNQNVDSQMLQVAL